MTYPTRKKLTEFSVEIPTVNDYVVGIQANEVKLFSVQELLDLSTSSLPYLNYVALLTQSGTSAPTATVLENTLGFTPTWVRLGAGLYSIQTAFNTAKTTVSIQPRYGVNLVLFGSLNSYLTLGTALSATTSYADGTLGDEFLLNSMIEIRVYP